MKANQKRTEHNVILKEKKWIAILSLCLIACSHPGECLPILGNPVYVGKDTNYPTIKSFSFIDQDSNTVTNKTIENKVYMADLFF